MVSENIARARAHITLVLIEQSSRLWPEEVTALERALAILNRFQ